MRAPDAPGAVAGRFQSRMEQIRERQLTGEGKRLHRLTHSKPQVEVLFDWIERQFQR